MRLDHHGVLFVPQRRFRLAGNQKQTRLILHVFNHPVAGHPIDVDIEDIQKDREPDAALFQVARLKLFLDGDHFPVAGSDHKIGVLRYDPGWIAKKPGGKQRRDGADPCDNRPAQPSGQ